MSLNDDKKTRIFTIGFTKKRAQIFFELLINSKVKILYDIRLNNASQLAGFTKKEDLEYFLSIIANIKYKHLPELSPTKEILDAYKKKEIPWEEYESRFNRLLLERKIENLFNIENLKHACFLCSEVKADQCHRRLVSEYLKNHFPDIVIHHL